MKTQKSLMDPESSARNRIKKLDRKGSFEKLKKTTSLLQSAHNQFFLFKVET